MPNAFPIWHIFHPLSSFLKQIIIFSTSSQKLLDLLKSLKNYMEQVFGHKGKIMVNPEQTRKTSNNDEQARTSSNNPEATPNKPRKTSNNVEKVCDRISWTIKT